MILKRQGECLEAVLGLKCKLFASKGSVCLCGLCLKWVVGEWSSWVSAAVSYRK